jgi:hypothetical protein
MKKSQQEILDHITELLSVGLHPINSRGIVLVRLTDLQYLDLGQCPVCKGNMGDLGCFFALDEHAKGGFKWDDDLFVVAVECRRARFVPTVRDIHGAAGESES